jgi:hypothetical protein
MTAEITFLAQFHLEFTVRVGQLPMLAHQVVEHIGMCVVHALQKYYDLKGYEITIACRYS